MYIIAVLRALLALVFQFFYMNLTWGLFPFYRIFRHDKQKIAKDVNDITHHWARFLLWQVGGKVVVSGQDNIPSEQPVIVVANHQSLYDIPILMVSLKFAVGFVAKRQLFYIPGLGFWMNNIRCLALDRSNPRQALTVFRASTKQMLQAKSGGLVIFPEGTRNRSPQLGPRPFKPGSMRLFLEKGLPVLPVTIFGSEQVGHQISRQVRVHIHPVQHLSTNSAAGRNEIAQGLQELISTSWHQLAKQTASV